MSSQLVGTNVVVIAHQFNPSILSQIWLVEHGLVQRDAEFGPNFIFSNDVTQVKTDEFALLVVPDQLQFVPSSEADEASQQRLIVEKVGEIVGLLPHTPYTAVGINFVWQIAPVAGGPELGRQIFFRSDVPLFAHFAAPDARFGGYLSREALGCRLRLDIKPVVNNETQTPSMQLAFNYHRDLSGIERTEGKIAAIREMMANWAEAKRQAETIMRSVQPEE